MSYTLIAIDMDETLLTPNLEISKKPIESNMKFTFYGLIVFILTDIFIFSTIHL